MAKSEKGFLVKLRKRSVSETKTESTFEKGMTALRVRKSKQETTLTETCKIRS